MRDDERRPTARGPLRWIAAGTLALLVLAGCQTDNDEHTENEEATSAPDGEADDGGIEMTFPAEGIELEGSLRLPDTEPAATVVVIAGSGPQSRDGWAAG
ncbi:MAG TPA: hypothetical protein VK024_07335, partial [Actinomycetaceae bacterium]|nr:hypothetical protein [Actinomycetaceae bacterium]